MFEVISIRLHAPEREVLSGTAEATDSSEIALPCENDTELYDFYINNFGAIDELETELITVMEIILK